MLSTLGLAVDRVGSFNRFVGVWSANTVALRLRVTYALVGCVVLVAIVLPRIAGAILPLGSDQGLYITIGEIIKRGGIVGRDAWDSKPPGIYYLYAALLAFAPDYSASCTITVPRLPSPQHALPCAQGVLAGFDIVYGLALAAAVWWVGRRLFGDPAGAIAALLCAVYASMLQITDGGGIADVYLLLPTSLAYATALQSARTGQVRWLALTGALGGVAALFKQTGLIPLAGIGVWLLVGRVPRWRGFAALAGGAVTILAVVAALLAASGVLADVVDQSLLFNFSYVGHPSNGENFAVHLVTQTWAVFRDSQSGLWLASVGGLAALKSLSARQSGLVVAWLLSSAATILAGFSQLHVNYYLMLVPVLSVLAGAGLARLWHESGRMGRGWIVLAAATLFVYSHQLQDHEYGNAWYSRLVSNTHSTEEFVAGAIGSGSGSLFVWGNGPQVYALSGRPPASRYLHTLAISYDYAIHNELQRNRAELMAKLESEPPQVIAIDTPWLRRENTLDFPELRALLARNYELANSPANPIFEGWEIYRLRSGARG